VNIKTDYLLKIDLQESIRKYDDPSEICKWVFETYGDILNTKTVNKKQVNKLFNKTQIFFIKIKKKLK
jgi:hypothetical protein